MLRVKSILFAMLFITPMAMGENDDSLSIIIAPSEEINPKRDCSFSDILLYIESDRVIIQFNGDICRLLDWRIISRRIIYTPLRLAA